MTPETFRQGTAWLGTFGFCTLVVMTTLYALAWARAAALRRRDVLRWLPLLTVGGIVACAWQIIPYLATQFLHINYTNAYFYTNWAVQAGLAVNGVVVAARLWQSLRDAPPRDGRAASPEASGVWPPPPTGPGGRP